MILSHRHRFIFIHCRKVAGSSISALLSPHLGPHDLQLGSWVEAFEGGARLNRRAWLDLLHPRAALGLIGRLVAEPAALLRKKGLMRVINWALKLKYWHSLGRHPEHPTAADLKAFDPAAWESYFKFCFVRNPYDRLVSDYLWRLHVSHRPAVGFLEFLESLQREYGSKSIGVRNWNNWPMYTIGDRIAVDFVGRYENLKGDLARACESIGLPLRPEMLARTKAAPRRRHYREWYGPREKELVERLCAQELNYFGYSF